MTLFSENDSVMVTLLIDNVFPLLRTDRRVLWLRNTLASYQDWYGFFKNADKIHEHHNYLVKLVTRKLRMLEEVNTGVFLVPRKRMSPELKYMKYRFGLDQGSVFDIPTIVEKNRNNLRSIFNSDDPNVKTHFFFVLGMMYSHDHPEGVTFYEFVDVVIKSLTTNP